MPLNDDELWEVFLEFAESFAPSEQEVEETRKAIHALTAELDTQANARRVDEINRLHKMAGRVKDKRH